LVDIEKNIKNKSGDWI